MILRRVIKHFRKQEWTAIFLDFIIVVVGVFVGLQVQNWSEAQANKRLEIVYLEALKVDFDQIITGLESDIAVYDVIIQAMETLLEQSRQSEPTLPVASLTRASGELIRMVGTEIVTDTYSNLTGSGDLALLRDQALKKDLASFYAATDTIRLVSDTHEMQLVSIFQPYIIENLDYISIINGQRQLISVPAGFDLNRVLAVLKSSKFRNVVSVKWDISSDLRGVLTRAIEKARKVETDLERELESHK